MEFYIFEVLHQDIRQVFFQFQFLRHLCKSIFSGNLHGSLPRYTKAKKNIALLTSPKSEVKI